MSFTALATAVIAFAATNIDDIFVLTLFFAQKKMRAWHVVTGQYLGFAALVAVSLIGYFARFIASRQWIGLLGLVPIAIGVKKIIEWRQGKGADREKPAGASVLTVAAVTVANGGDNIGIYTPLFASSEAAQLIVMLSVFFVLIGVWCVVGYFLGNHPAVGHVLELYGHVIVPFVLIGLGIYIILESGTLSLIGLG
jgi:cadmium resistance transport/sequestration family protein